MADGLTLGQLSGIWITGAAPGAAAPAGLTLNQLTGVWITGAPATTVTSPAAISLLQLSGVWVTGSLPVIILPPVPEDPGGSGAGGGWYLELGRSEMDLKRNAKAYENYLTILLIAIIEVINEQNQ